MKKILLGATLALLTLTTYAQHKNEADTISTQTLFHRLAKIEKKTDYVNVHLNMRASFNAGLHGDDDMKFRFDQIRLSIGGKINSWLSYMYRQRLNRSFDGSGYLDNVSGSLDMAYIKVQPTEKFSMTMGKQAACFGGFEFDANPINEYEYSDMVNSMVDFATGVTFSYHPSKNHTLSAQVVNVNYKKYEENEDLKNAKAPFAYSLYWAGNMCGGNLLTIWSASYIHDAKDYNRFMIAFGNQIKLCPKMTLTADVTYSNEDMDTRGIVSGAVARYGVTDKVTKDVEYLSTVAKLNYAFTPKWSLSFKGMYETAGFRKDKEVVADTNAKNVRTSYGYIGTVEFAPMGDGNLRFFANYVGRSYNFTHSFGEKYNTDRVAVGFIYKLPVF